MSELEALRPAANKLLDGKIDDFAIVLAGMVRSGDVNPNDGTRLARLVLVSQIMSYVELFPEFVQRSVAATLLSDINTAVLQLVEGGAHEKPLH